MKKIFFRIGYLLARFDREWNFLLERVHRNSSKEERARVRNEDREVFTEILSKI
jgi:hypothetical protein